jgi:hypothetical protein
MAPLVAVALRDARKSALLRVTDHIQAGFISL